MRICLITIFAMALPMAAVAADTTRPADPPPQPASIQASAGLSGQTGAAAPATAPAAGSTTSCSHRSPTHVSIGGIDLDMTKCQTEKLSIQFAQAALQLVKDTALIEMLQSDLEDAQAQVADLKKKAASAPNPPAPSPSPSPSPTH